MNNYMYILIATLYNILFWDYLEETIFLNQNIQIIHRNHIQKLETKTNRPLYSDQIITNNISNYNIVKINLDTGPCI